MPASIAGLLKKMADRRIHLDLNLNLSLSLPVLKLIGNTASLLILLFKGIVQ